MFALYSIASMSLPAVVDVKADDSAPVIAARVAIAPSADGASAAAVSHMNAVAQKFFGNVAWEAKDTVITNADLNTAALNFNGPEEVGIAAAAEPPVGIEDKIVYPVAAAPLVRAAVAFVANNPPNGCDATLGSLYRIGAAWVAYGGWAHRDDVNSSAADLYADKVTDKLVGSVKAKMASAEMQPALLMLFAPIVAWWMTNHHTGGSPMSGFCLKAVRTILDVGSGVDESATKAVWRMGHWIHKPTLFAAPHWNVRGAAAHGRFDVDAPFPRMSRDIKIRMDGAAAGVHRLTTVRAVLDRARNSDFGVLVPVPHDARAIFVNSGAALRAGCRSHVGSKYLTGEDMLKFDEPSEDAMRIASAFAHSALKNTSLSRAKVLLSEADVASDSVFGNLQAVRLAASVRDLSTDDVARVIGTMTVGAANMKAVAVMGADDYKRALDRTIEARDAAQGVANDESASVEEREEAHRAIESADHHLRHLGSVLVID